MILHSNPPPQCRVLCTLECYSSTWPSPRATPLLTRYRPLGGLRRRGSCLLACGSWVRWRAGATGVRRNPRRCVLGALRRWLLEHLYLPGRPRARVVWVHKVGAYSWLLHARRKPAYPTKRVSPPPPRGRQVVRERTRGTRRNATARPRRGGYPDRQRRLASGRAHTCPWRFDDYRYHDRVT